MKNITLTKFAGEADTYYLDCTSVLEEADTITGVVTMSYLPDDLSGADALSFGTPVVNSVAIQFPDGNVGKIGGVISVRISGGDAASAVLERDYTVIATFGTAQGNTKVVRGRLQLLPMAL